MKEESKPKIIISKDGPYQVSGNLPLDKEYIVPDNNGDPLKWKKGEKYPNQDSYHLCRCGQSKDKPFCDGTHTKGFDGTETAPKNNYAKRSDKTVGPELDLIDCQELCSGAKFCHRAEGAWELTEKSDNPNCKEMAIEEACNCPSGRLTAQDKSGKLIEPEFDPSISITESPAEGVSGPLWVKGGVEIESADGKKYEKRNRVTLCRCGHSKNKPFCDGTHIDIRFNDTNKKPAQ